MHLQQFLTVSSFMVLGNAALGAELDNDDVPNQCWSVCGSVVGTAHRCDGIHDNDDRAEMQCICDWNQASHQIPLCEACIAQVRENNNERDPHDNDAYEILQSCSLSTTTYASATQTADVITTSTGETTPTSTSTNVDDTDDDNDDTNDDTGNDTDTDDEDDGPGNAASTSSVSKTASLAAVMGLGMVALI